MERIKRFFKTHRILTVAVAAVMLAAAVVLNILYMGRVATRQAVEIGGMRVQSVSAGLQRPLAIAAATLDRVAAELEEAVSSGASEEEMRQLLSNLQARESRISGSGCVDIFCVVNGQVMISDAETPADYVLQDRLWYRGLLTTRIGEMYFSPAHENMFALNTVSYTAVKYLSDGQTIVGTQYSMEEIQKYISGLRGDGYGDVMIVDANGAVVAATNTSLVGEHVSARNQLYYDVFLKAYSAGAGGGVQVGEARDGTDVFCGRTETDWYVLCVLDSGLLYQGGLGQLLRVLAALSLVALVAGLAYVSLNRQRILQTIADSGVKIDGAKETLAQVFDSASIRKKRRGRGKTPTRFVDEDDADEMTAAKQRKYRMAMTAVFLVTTVIVLVISTARTVSAASSDMSYEVQAYKRYITQWTDEQQQIMDMFANVLIAKPELLDDYDGLVRFLDSVTRRYPGISATYIANPDFAHGHPLVMNNGWVPGPDFNVEERTWYLATTRDHWRNISEPYLDARTGAYCITMSRVVASDSGQFYGVFAIDYYVDALTSIIDANYSDTDYAFLADRNGLIISHPNAAYKQTEKLFNLPCASVLRSTGPVSFRDYDGKLKVALSARDADSGLRVVLVRNWWSTYRNIFLFGAGYLLLLGICSFAANFVISLLNKWQRKTNEDLKEAAESAIKAEQTKMQFLSNISHELRTPINAVLGMNEMILRECKEEHLKAYAMNIQSSGKTLLFLINDILDMSRIESGKMKIVPVQYEPGEVIADLWNVHLLRAQEKGLRLNFTVDENVPRVLYGDDVRIKQIITNILTNAIKYTHKGGIDLHVTYADTGFKMVALIVSVKDTGIGIKKEDMSKLFESFQRLEEEKNRNIEGAGLGMSIVMSLLKQMGGDMRVESEYGKGSTFTVSIPQRVIDADPTGDFEAIHKRQMQALEEGMAQRAFEAPGARVMVVDDNEMNLAVFKALLNRTKIQVTAVNSGPSCLEHVKEKPYHLIFMDHMMPEMDGVETLREIKKLTDCPNADTPVVALTANAQSGAREDYIRVGFTDFLTKPIDAPQLERMILQYLPSELILEIEDQVEEKAEAVSDGGAYQAYGISLEQGLHYSTGNMDVYLDLIAMFVHDTERRRKLEQFLAEGNMKDYSILVHSLKGNARTLGATKLADEAYEHERESKEDNAAYVLAHWDELITFWETTKEGLSAIYRDQRGEELRRADESAAQEDAAEVPEGEAITISAQELAEVAALIDNFESEKAVEQLKAWLRQPLCKADHDRVKAALVALEDEFDEGRAMKLLKG